MMAPVRIQFRATLTRLSLLGAFYAATISGCSVGVPVDSSDASIEPLSQGHVDHSAGPSTSQSASGSGGTERQHESDLPDKMNAIEDSESEVVAAVTTPTLSYRPGTAVPAEQPDPEAAPSSREEEEPCEPARSKMAGIPLSPFRGLVHATEWASRGEQSVDSGPNDSKQIAMTFIDSARSSIISIGLCTRVPAAQAYCGTWLTPQPDGMLYARVGGSDQHRRIMALAKWGDSLELLVTHDDRLEDPEDGQSRPRGAIQKSLSYGQHDFAITEYDNGFALQYGDVRREYAFGPWERRVGAQGTFETLDDPLLTNERFNDEGFYILGGSFYFAGTDGRNIGVIFDHAEPACSHKRELYIFSLQYGTVQSCLIFSGSDAFSLHASPGSYEPLDDIGLPPSGWLYTDPCTIFSRHVEGADFGGSSTDWPALAETILPPS